jgi:exosortase
VTTNRAVVPVQAAVSSRCWLPYAVSAALVGCLLWSYWPTVKELCEFWARNQDYSVGALVPLVAVYLVWRDRVELRRQSIRPCWWGCGVILLAEVARLGGVYFGYGSAERYALVLCIAGAVLLAAGRTVFRRLVWVLAFLLLMVPLPARVHELIALPLQNLATASAVFGLELLGFFVVREGNVLQLETGQSVAVAEACSGLRMLTAFVFVAALLAFLVDRPRWHKLVLLLFSVPVAVFCNSLRVIATSLFVHYSGSSALTTTFHDAAGLAMMPLAILISVGLLSLLRMFSEAQPASTPVAGRGNVGPRSVSARGPGSAPGTADRPSGTVAARASK